MNISYYTSELTMHYRYLIDLYFGILDKIVERAQSLVVQEGYVPKTSGLLALPK
jgi:hypothetical protein